MILIVEAGSTKTQCILAGKNIKQSFTVPGINPRVQPPETIVSLVKNLILPGIKDKIVKKIYYYGAGCGSPEKCNLIRRIFSGQLKPAEVFVYTDLLGAARAVFLNSSGIISILGTGSNSGVYNGLKIIENIPSTGYILGDEGSGANLGKNFIRDLLYGSCPVEYKKLFFKRFPYSNDEIIEMIYQKPQPNVFLAQIGGFVIDNRDDHYFKQLIKNSITDFFSCHILPYEQCKSYKLGFVGSVAFLNRQTITEIAQSFGLIVSDFIKSPIENLVKYHVNLTGH